MVWYARCEDQLLIKTGVVAYRSITRSYPYLGRKHLHTWRRRQDTDSNLTSNIYLVDTVMVLLALGSSQYTLRVRP